MKLWYGTCTLLTVSCLFVYLLSFPQLKVKFPFEQVKRIVHRTCRACRFVNYFKKVDNLKTSGIVQGFWSLNPNPLDGENSIKTTKKEGFIRFDSYESLRDSLAELLSTELNFFSSMESKETLGRFIEIAERESTYEQKAEKFLKLLEYKKNE